MRKSLPALLALLGSCLLLSCAGGSKSAPREDCTNQLDDDGDGATDCDDSDCAAHVACINEQENCVNGTDDDGDGQVDCNDPDCFAAAACQINAENCVNGLDDDGDGAADCDDSDCVSHASCQATPENCTNDLDDDGDGATDCDDSDCVSHASCQATPENCTNGLDDDGDGATDCDDSDCTSHASCQVPPEDCTNGLDDDGDGATDCADSECTAHASCVQICTLSEGFEGGTVPPAGWTRVNQSSYTWVIADAATYSSHGGSWIARVPWDENLANQNEVLISPVIRCSGRSITFWAAASYNWAITEGNYDVALWVVVGDWGGGDDFALSGGILAGRGAFTNWEWLQFTFAIPAQFNNQSIRLAWQYVGADAADFYLDDVLLQ